MMDSPLLIGTDLRKATPATLAILGNKDVIALDQDPLGSQATVVSSDGDAYVLTKQLADGDRAVALFNASRPGRSASPPPPRPRAFRSAAATRCATCGATPTTTAPARCPRPCPRTAPSCCG